MANVTKSHIESEPTDGYAAFYYEWENVTTNKKYGGYHVGSVNDGYNHSSKNPEMIDDFQNVEHEWKYSVLHYGTKEVIKDIERTILKSNEARTSDNWYNLTNGGSDYDILGDKILNICELVNNRTWLQLDLLGREAIKILLEGGIQVRRDNSEPKFIKHISTLIDDKGDTSNTNPLILIEISKEGECRLLNGNTTAQATLNSKHGMKLQYQIIPYSLIKDFSANDIRGLGLALNPKSKNPTNPTNIPDAVAYVVEAYISGKRPINHPSNIEYLQGTLNFSSSQRRTVIKEGQAQIDCGKIQSNVSLIRYSQPANKPKLDKRIAELESKLPNTKVFAYTSSMVRYGDIVTWLMSNHGKSKNNKVANVVLLVHFASYLDIKKWKSSESLLNSNRMQSLCSVYGLGWHDIEEMDKY